MIDLAPVLAFVAFFVTLFLVIFCKLWREKKSLDVLKQNIELITKKEHGEVKARGVLFKCELFDDYTKMLDPKETDVTTLHLRPEFQEERSFLPDNVNLPSDEQRNPLSNLLENSIINSSNFIVPTPLFEVSFLQKQNAVTGGAREVEHTI